MTTTYSAPGTTHVTLTRDGLERSDEQCDARGDALSDGALVRRIVG